MNDTFYKATRTDGGSFHDPTVIYEVGKRVRPKPHTGERNLCGAGVLHASEHPWHAAKYTQGEFRLFLVEGKPFIEQWDKAGFKQLTVLAEVPVHEAFGPHGVQVQAVWERWLAATDNEKQQLWDAWAARAARAARDAWDAWDARDAWGAWDAWGARGAWAARDAWDARAARGAALAYMAPEATGTYGYTQEHYDALVGPWESMFGVWDEGIGEFVKGDS
ncbi:hypothetical protein LCGC14_2486360 [marine sediment metagenome]|uniref:Uncharacterized protein n=1 Tax=marine sediment metagenome TaxID=412755 RepID=A0A0F9B6V8_9ZZZZ